MTLTNTVLCATMFDMAGSVRMRESPMQQSGIEQAPAIERVYRYTFRSPRVLLGWLIAYPLSLAIVVVLSGLLPPHHFSLDPFVAISSFVGIGIGAALAARTTTLTVTLDGIGYRRSGRYSWVLWQDIEAIRPWSRGYYGWAAGEGLVIRATILSPSGSPHRRTFSRYFIPLEWFAPQWRESPLGEEIRRYAPWLFTEANAIHQ